MYVHGDNIKQKENHRLKYQSDSCLSYIKEIRAAYDVWRDANEQLKGPFREIAAADADIVASRVTLLNRYKDFIDQQRYAEAFDSRSNLHSSVLEEFMFYLFRDLVREFSENALIGKSHTFKDIFFTPKGFQSMLSYPSARIEKKDHDFAIGVHVNANLACKGTGAVETDVWDLPAVAVECKTYLDKTMLQDASTAAEQLKIRNPNAIYIVVAEWLKLTESVNLAKYKIDQIYILRKQKNTDREYRYLEKYVKNPIYTDAVMHLFSLVRSFLVNPWEGGISFGIDRGYLK